MGKQLGSGSAAELMRVLYSRYMLEGGAPLAGFDPFETFVLRDDFETYHATNRWTAVVASTGSAALEATAPAGGQIKLLTAATDNDSTILKAPVNFVGLAGRRIAFEIRLMLTEGNTDDAGVVVGLTSDQAATLMQADGAGPVASGSHVVFFKVDGGTKWQFETSNGATQTTDTDVGARTSATWVRLGAVLEPSADGLSYSVTPYVDGVQAGDAQTLLIASLAVMGFTILLKSGGANVETMHVDYVMAVADR
jgi:hypothetical protein